MDKNELEQRIANIVENKLKEREFKSYVERLEKENKELNARVEELEERLKIALMVNDLREGKQPSFVLNERPPKNQTIIRKV